MKKLMLWTLAFGLASCQGDDDRGNVTVIRDPFEPNAQPPVSGQSNINRPRQDESQGGRADMAANDTRPGPQMSCRPGLGRAESSSQPNPWFTDISDISGIRRNNVLHDANTNVPINDHSRLGFVDLDGDGDDDIVAHSLFPNPLAGIPFDHLVFLNNGDGTFVNHSDASGLRHVQAGFFAFADVDNDGDQDCFAGLDVPNLPGQTHQLLLNDGFGVFSPMQNSGVERLPGMAGNAVFADFDGDAILDLYVGMGHTSFAERDYFMLGRGDGTFASANERLVGRRAQPTNGLVTCDYDGDGDLDILASVYGVSQGGAHNVLWENNGTGEFIDAAVDSGFAYQMTGNYQLPQTNYGTAHESMPMATGPIGSNGFGLDCDDVDGDGDIDIWMAAISHPVVADYTRLWSDPSQLLMTERRNGQAVFINRFLEKGLPFNEGDVDAAIVDFDLDGLPDLSLSRDKKYEANYADIEQKAWFGLMHQLADGRFESIGHLSGINDLEGGHTASLTPCNESTQCSVAGEVCLFEKCRWPCQQDGDCSSSRETCHVPKGFCKPLLTMKNAQNHAWSDIDGDGDLDLLVGGRDTGGGRPNFLFRNDIGAANPWIKLRLQGDGIHVNRDAIGTKVVATRRDGRVRTQWVKAGRGMHTSMDTRWVHVGLGDAGCDASVHIRWPNGLEVEFAIGELQANVPHTVRYPNTVITQRRPDQR